MVAGMDVLCIEFDSERKIMQKKTHLILFIIILLSGVVLALAPIDVPEGIDKVYHFLGFFVISISAITTYSAFFGKKTLNSFMIFLLTLGGLIAGLSENAQNFVAIRGCDIFDWFANLSGISLACLLAFFLNFLKEKNEEI